MQQEDTKIDPSTRQGSELIPAQAKRIIDLCKVRGVDPSPLVKNNHQRWTAMIKGIKKDSDFWQELFLVEFKYLIRHYVLLSGYYPGIDQEDVYQEAYIEILYFLKKKDDIQIATLPGLVKTHVNYWFADYCKYLNRHVRETVRFKHGKEEINKTPVTEGSAEAHAWPEKESKKSMNDEPSIPGPEYELCQKQEKCKAGMIRRIVRRLPKMQQIIIKGHYRYRKTDQQLANRLKSPRLAVWRLRQKVIATLLPQFEAAGLRASLT